MLPTPVFLPRESHGQRSLVGYSPQGLKESDTTECVSLGSISEDVFCSSDWAIYYLLVFLITLCCHN